MKWLQGLICALKTILAFRKIGQWKGAVERSRGSECCCCCCCSCCCASYWKSGQVQACSAGVGTFSHNENQMLPWITPLWPVEILCLLLLFSPFALFSSFLSFSSSLFSLFRFYILIWHSFLLTLPPFQSYVFPYSPFWPSSLSFTLSFHLFQVPFQVCQLHDQTHRPNAGGHILEWASREDRCCLRESIRGEDRVLRRYSRLKQTQFHSTTMKTLNHVTSIQTSFSYHRHVSSYARNYL